MGSASRRKRKSQQVRRSGKVSKRQQNMSTETQEKLVTGNRKGGSQVAPETPFEDPFVSRDAEYKAGWQDSQVQDQDH